MMLFDSLERGQTQREVAEGGVENDEDIILCHGVEFSMCARL